MATIKIPAKIYTVCDVCGKTNEKHNFDFKKKSKLKVKRNGLDQLGDAVCDGSYELDLCDFCDEKITEYIENLKKGIAK